MDVDARGPHDWPLLITAAHSGNPDVVRWLLDQGADIAATDSFGKSVLHQAAMRGHTDVIRLLLDRGMDANAPDRTGHSSSIHLAASHAHPAEDACGAIALLLERGVNVDARDIRGKTALMLAALAGKQVLFHFLLDHGADIDAQTEDGMTALMQVVRSGFCNKDMVRMLLQAGATSTARDATGRTALMWAESEASTEIVQMLLVETRERRKSP